MFGLASFDVVMRLIWQTTLVLVATGLVLMAGLVLRRLLEEWRESRHRPAREQLRKSLLASLNGPVGNTPAPPPGLPIAETARLVDELAQIVRGDARQRLAAFAVEAGVERHWLRRLGSRLTPYRLEAARCLALLDTERSRAALAACLEHKSPRLRLAAAEALAHDPKLAATLAARFAAEPSASGRHATRFWHRIATIAPDKLVECLGAAELRPELGVRLVEALGDAGHGAAAAGIEALIGCHGAALDRAALAALDRLKHPLVMRATVSLAAAADPESRRAAVAVLARRGRTKDLEILQTLAADPVTDIAIAANAILARLAAPAATGAQPA
jgi:HEAT repeat protein